MAIDADRDIYGRHHGSFGTVPWRIHGRDTRLPFSALCHAFDTYGAGKHVATYDHPAGVYFERNGLITRVEHPYRPGPNAKPYSAAFRFLRHDEKSAASYRALREARAQRRTP